MLIFSAKYFLEDSWKSFDNSSIINPDFLSYRQHSKSIDWFLYEGITGI